MRLIHASAVALLAICLLLVACEADDFNLAEQAAQPLPQIHVERTHFKDAHGRYMFVHGVNVGGSTKFPATENPISYVGKPFPLEKADENFTRLRDAGFNVLRLLVIWEALEPEASGQYDYEYLDYIEQIVSKANDYGIYVFLDMHQDLYSRHLAKYYTDSDLLDGMDLDVPQDTDEPLNNLVRGDGAPRWAVQVPLFDKNVSSPEWGMPPEDVDDPADTNDMLAIDPWGVNYFTSIDLNRCWAVFFAGRSVYPNWYIEGKNVQDFLQDSFTNAWLQVVTRVKDYPNVMGYDILNEPGGFYLMFTIYAITYREMLESGGHDLTPAEVDVVLDEAVAELLQGGMPSDLVQSIRDFIVNSGRMPDTAQKLAAGGFPLKAAEGSPYRPDFGASIALNSGFNRNYLQPFHERVGQAMQAQDPDAIFFIEESIGLGDANIGVYWSPMLKPEGLDQVVFAPHYYADIYPFLGYDASPREFTVDEVKYRDYTEKLQAVIDSSAEHLSNVPVLLGEFGTYFNFGGIEQARAENYAVSTEILDNYFEALETLMMHHTMWNYSPENEPLNGDGWNEEDFSILGPDRQYRSATAYIRPYARFSAGRPLETHFYSDHHYYDPIPGQPTPYHEYYLAMDSLESSAPTEIIVPRLQYPEGFYVYLSDGRCAFDHELQLLYWYIDDGSPDVDHTIRIRPPYQDSGDSEWDYFFFEDAVRENGRRS
ncbi:MAG: cellulase family glycosylhydrolase [Candidatus Alcyoniella australis]|nr:cellulase family glycosylhydrolase [Candidatus Alcyoniella australis]